MATESSTAPPKDSACSTAGVSTFPLKKITLQRMTVSIKRAAMATVFILPRLEIPTMIQRIMRAPMTTHHKMRPVPNMPSAARAPS